MTEIRWLKLFVKMIYLNDGSNGSLNETVSFFANKKGRGCNPALPFSLKHGIWIIVIFSVLRGDQFGCQNHFGRNLHLIEAIERHILHAFDREAD